MSDASDRPSLDRVAGLLLVAAIFLFAVCGLVYELIAGTLSSYLLGDSVTQFSIVIGLFLAAMGVGSFLSRYFHRDLLGWFVRIELAAGLIGGFTSLAGFATFAYTDFYVPVLLALVGVVGVLVGLEIPLMVRILRGLHSLPVTLANVLSADYLGALVAAVLFPFALLPWLGLVRSGLVIGLVNVFVAGLLLWRFGPVMPRRTGGLKAAVIACALVLAVGIAASGRLLPYLENRLYQDEVIFAADTPHQRLVLTRWHGDVRLYLNGHLQFSSIDEYRYHEALVHPAMALAERRARVLVLGGGDGLAVREVAKYPEVERIDLVDLDPVVTDLFRTRSMLTTLNGDALNDPRVRIHNTDAMRFLESGAELYDVILMDLPDPSGPAIGKLYSRAFFGLAGRRLAAGGVLASQCTSPFRARRAYWCILHTAAAARFGPEGADRLHVRGYHTFIPTFGTWGFMVAARRPLDAEGLALADVPTRYLTADLLAGLFVFPPDMAEVETPISRLDDPVICRLYRQGYHKHLQ